jgi:organic radical activating enzyme
MDLFDRVNGAANYKPKTLVVITGGEPFRQDIAAFANLLIDMGHPVQIETNGTLPPSEGLDARVVVVCSPKTGKINPIMLKRLDCFKYVLHSESVTENGLPIKALGHSAKPFVAQPPEGNRKPVYLQPMDSKNIAQNERNNAAVLKSCLDNGYILQLQIHKLIGVE